MDASSWFKSYHAIQKNEVHTRSVQELPVFPEHLKDIVNPV